jgi:hypothetical protein
VLLGGVVVIGQSTLGKNFMLCIGVSSDFMSGL